MRDINLHIVHCADTPPDMDIGVSEINEWHLQRGWSGVGYHYVIRRDGTLERGRTENAVGAHCKRKNRHSIGTCLVGGYRGKKDFTEAQFKTLSDLHRDLIKRYDLKIAGHFEYDPVKTCPNFDVKSWWYLESHKEEESKPKPKLGWWGKLIKFFKGE